MAIWIIERSVFGAAADEFEAAVQRAGGQCKWLSEHDEVNGRYGAWSDKEAVVFRGSFEAAESFRRAKPGAWPGVLGEQAALRCSSYYPAVGKYLLNDEYVFVPIVDLRRLWPALLRMFSSESLFVRPDSGSKAFTGQLVADLQHFENRERPYIEALASTELCLVARPRHLSAEYRMVSVGGKIVAGSQYKLEGQRIISPEAPLGVWAFARSVVTEIAVSVPAFMLDIAVEEGGRLSVIEINSFSCSDLYASDPFPVVEAVESLATSWPSDLQTI